MKTPTEAWTEFYARVYTTDYVNLSDLLGSDWRAGQAMNVTPGQYKRAAYQRMISLYGDEPEGE